MLKLIILIIIAILVLSYFGISIQHVAESPTGVNNFTYVWSAVLKGWSILLGWLSGFVNSTKHVFSA